MEDVKANIFIGSSADHSKKKSLQIIAHEWGSDWFEEIPRELCDPTWTQGQDCSKCLLGQVVKNAQKGYTFDRAIDHWTWSMKQCINERAQVELRICLPCSCYVILDDVCSLNERDDDRDVPDSPKHDQLRVELVPPVAPSPQALKKPDFSAAGPPRAPSKRKRNTAERPVVSMSSNSISRRCGKAKT
jgi:hypothetical protein